MSIITLTTDYGPGDYAVGALHGSIRTLYPTATIEDISHSVQPYDVGEAAYILSHASVHFPSKTVHILGVGSYLGTNQPHLVAEHNQQYFIGTDNGFFHLLTSVKKADQIVELEIPWSPTAENPDLFPVRDLFVKAAVHLAKGGPLSVLGKTYLHKLSIHQHMPSASDDGNRITGQIILIDRFGNAITNITRDLFRRIGAGRSFSAQLPRTGTPKFNRIASHYFDEPVAGNPRSEMLLFNSANHLEIAIQNGDLHSNGGAARLMGLKRGDQITINFK